MLVLVAVWLDGVGGLVAGWAGCAQCGLLLRGPGPAGAGAVPRLQLSDRRAWQQPGCSAGAEQGCRAAGTPGIPATSRAHPGDHRIVEVGDQGRVLLQGRAAQEHEPAPAIRTAASLSIKPFRCPECTAIRGASAETHFSNFELQVQPSVLTRYLAGWRAAAAASSFSVRLHQVQLWAASRA